MKRGCFFSMLILAAFFGGYWIRMRVLVHAGAKLDAVSSKWHSTALMRALDAEHPTSRGSSRTQARSSNEPE